MYFTLVRRFFFEQSRWFHGDKSRDSESKEKTSKIKKLDARRAGFVYLGHFFKKIFYDITLSTFEEWIS